MNTANMIDSKEEKLRVWMRKKGRVLVAYSGGVDSAYLGLIATQELGARAVCVTGVSASVSEFQLGIAKRIAVEHGFNHRLLNTNELGVESYTENLGNRCYFCKTELYSRIQSLCAKDFPGTSIVDGTNADDVGDHRPGRVAATELGVESPLEILGFSKNEIREFSRKHDLETWDQPASPCLSSRVAIGVPVTIERLDRIEKGESLLRSYGFKEFRLRVHGKKARIEIATDEMAATGFKEVIREVSPKIKKLGFHEVSLDPEGYRSGFAEQDFRSGLKI